MHRNKLIEKLDAYNPEQQIEKLDKDKMLNFLKSHKNCFDRSLSLGHFTGSCWLENYDSTKFLLTEHKKLEIWLQLGGHADGNNDLIQVALKEAKEESGLNDIVLLSDCIFDIGVHVIPEYQGEPEHYHYDVRFLLKAVNEKEKIQISEESINLEWFSDIPIPYHHSFNDLSRMFKKWK